MKWKVLVTLLVVGGGACFLLANRYSVVGTNRGVVYKTDRLTGRTWMITEGEQSLVRPTFRDLHPEEWQAQQEAEAERRDVEARRRADQQRAKDIERARLAELQRQRDARIELTQQAEVWLADALRLANRFRDLDREIGRHRWSFDPRDVQLRDVSKKEFSAVLSYQVSAQMLADESRGLLKDQPIGIRVQEISKAASVLKRYSDPWPPVDKWQGFDDFREAQSTKNESDLLADELRSLKVGRFNISLEEWREGIANSDPQSDRWFYAKFQLIALLLETNPLLAREEMGQLKQLNPDSIPQPWAARLRALDRRIDGQINEAKDGQGDDN